MARRKKNLLGPVIITLIALITVAIVAYYISYLYKPSFVHYKEFGISLPVNYSIHGIDVSRYQKNISWKEVKEMQVKDIHIGFVFIKATEGVNKTDEQFRRNWLNAGREGIPKGAYHFFNTGRSGKLQAENFFQT